MVLVHVFALGYGLVYWKLSDGVGWNPSGGSDGDPVANCTILSKLMENWVMDPSWASASTAPLPSEKEPKNKFDKVHVHLCL